MSQYRQGDALDLDIQGTAGHTHLLSLSASDLNTIQAGGRLEKETSGTRHTHTVTFQG